MKSVPSIINRHELNDYNRLCARADVFSRAALEDTFRLLRKSKPGVALKIQNILNSNPLRKPAALVGDKRTDSFQLVMEADEIQTVIAALAAQASVTDLEKIQGNVTALGNLVILKTLMSDWVDMAKLFIDTEGTMEPLIRRAANL